MPVFQVRQGATGAILWTGSAASEIQALDAMAHEAGYYDHSDIPDPIRHGGLTVETLNLDGTGRSVGGRSGQTRGHSTSGSTQSERVTSAR